MNYEMAISDNPDRTYVLERGCASASGNEGLQRHGMAAVRSAFDLVLRGRLAVLIDSSATPLHRGSLIVT